MTGNYDIIKETEGLFALSAALVTGGLQVTVVVSPWRPSCPLNQGTDITPRSRTLGVIQTGKDKFETRNIFDTRAAQVSCLR
ncbi:hypothetical protein GJAV_G00232160 [Gymnothorax javanicus]|nr:hypothetical protein GJAV_G00232160 [Gymnothorax javanicus]